MAKAKAKTKVSKEYNTVLKKYFARTKNITAKQAEEAAETAYDNDDWESAEALKEYAFEVKKIEAETADEESKDEKPKPKPKPKGKGKGKGRRKVKKSSLTPRTKKALTDAVIPDAKVARNVRSASNVFWTFAGGIIGLTAFYLVVKNPARANSLLKDIEELARGLIYPYAAFPEKWDF